MGAPSRDGLSSLRDQAPSGLAHTASIPSAGLSIHDEEFMAGYFDGRDPASPEPSDNRSHCYRHSFAIGRAELANKPILASVSRAAAAEAEAKDASA